MNRSFLPRADAFSLVVTLIIISMLAVVAIGFLSSMSSERVTADAYGNRGRADQAAQAGTDSAMAILRQAFKDFPDSATVWETHSKNTQTKFDKDKLEPYNEGTSLYVRAMPNGDAGLPDPAADNGPNHIIEAPAANAGGDARTTFVLPLISGAAYKTLETKDTAVNSGAAFTKVGNSDLDNFVDLNVLRYKGDPQGWIGSPPPPSPTPATNGASPKTVRVPWVDIKQADAKDPSKAPVVARYAFWVEDESFRTNVNYAGTGNGAVDPTTRRADNSASFTPAPSPAPAADRMLTASNVDLYFPLHFVGDASAVSRASALTKTRSIYPAGLFPETLGYSHGGDGSEFTAAERLDSSVADQLRFLTTTTSAGLNLSRHGSQRLALNGLIYPQGVSGDPAPAKTAIDALIKTIGFHAPNFGQRFYRITATWPGTLYTAAPYTGLNALDVKGDPDTASVLHDHKLIYLNRIAANIFDYMDPDSQPTFIDQTGAVVTGVFQGLEGFNRVSNASPIWANGKEGIPYMDECAARFRLAPYDSASPSRYRLFVDYYIELWNMTGRDITLGPGARIRVSQPPPWVGNLTATGATSQDTYMPSDEGNNVSPSSSREFPDASGNTDPKRDYDIDISGLVFKAGRASIITTDPDWKDIVKNWKSYNEDPSSIATPPNIFLCNFISPGKRVYGGTIPNARGTSTRCKVIHIPPGAQYSNTGSSDYKTSVVIYNDKGYLDLLEGAVPMANNGAFSITFPTSTNATGTALTPGNTLYGGSLRGNSGSYPSLSGDPRTNNEQMDYVLYLSGGPVDQSRYFNFTYVSNSGSTATGATTNSDSSLGTPNINFFKPDRYDLSGYTPWPDFIDFKDAQSAANVPMALGNAPLTSIGQLGDVFDPARWSPASDQRTLNAARGGGRTLKIGQHDDRWDGDVMSPSHSWASWRLADFFCTDNAMLQPGLININGVARDNGAALRAALSGLKFQANAPNGRGAPKLEGANALNVDPMPTPAANAASSPGLDAVITQIKKRLLQPTGSGETKYGITGYEPLNTGRGPFFERGELSEIPAFGRNILPPSTATTTPYKATDLAGIDLNQVTDRGREELFRRLVEMTTTRGSVFTVYAMGQSIVERPNPSDPSKPYKHPTSTQRIKVTFRLAPKGKSTGATTTAPDFHPATDATGAALPFADANVRFARPDHYDIEILSSSRGGG